MAERYPRDMSRECMHFSAAITLTLDTCPRSFTGMLIDMHRNTNSCKFIMDCGLVFRLN